MMLSIHLDKFVDKWSLLREDDLLVRNYVLHTNKYMLNIMSIL